MKRTLTIFVIMMALVFSILPACAKSPVQSQQKGPITVATMIDTEGPLLGNMVILLLEQDGFSVVDKTEFGTPDILRKALLQSEVDLVIDYTGSGQYYHDGTDEEAWSDAQKGYELIKQLDKEANNLIWLTPANANNTEALAVKREFSEANKISSMEDLANYVKNEGKIKLITASSFAENIKGLRGMEEAYGFKLTNDQMIILASGNTTEMLKALIEGKDDVNVSLVYGTDGALEEMDLVVLKDPKSIPPVYLPAPVLRGELYEKYPETEGLLKPLFEGLTIETLRQLNAKVAFESQSSKKVAEEYLKQAGLLR
jgi:osmoprotectant transport system substrate-binding protein